MLTSNPLRSASARPPDKAAASRSAWRRRLDRVHAWLALILLAPRNTTPVLVCIAAFAVAGLFVLIGTKFTQDLFKDCAEAFAWGRRFLAGYGRHPPLTGWIAGLWYTVFPASSWASFLLSRLLIFVALASTYLVARRVLGPRRAALVAFVMMLYPLFIGAKSDRLNNYQVLLALTPVLILTFLVAYERRTALWGVLLGLAGAAALMTIYSGGLAVAGVVAAAVLHPGRRRFFASPTPYIALLVGIVAISPHLVWLVRHDFLPLHWAGDQLHDSPQFKPLLNFAVHQTGLVAIPLLVGALTLLPWRLNVAGARPVGKSDPILAVIIAAVLIVTPIFVGLLFKLRFKLEWGDPLFFLAPAAALALVPRLAVTRRAVTRMAAVAAFVIVAYLVGSPFYALSTFKSRPGYDVYAPTSELAGEVTRLWRERFNSPVPIVAGAFEIVAPVSFYSPDHPRVFADSPDEPRVYAADQPQFSPWIDYPADLGRYGFVGICYVGDGPCKNYLERLAPDAQVVSITLAREVAGIKAMPWTFHVAFAPPH